MSFIVVGVDGSDTSLNALQAALQQAATGGHEVRAVTVVSMPAMTGYEFGPINMQEMTSAAEDALAGAVADATASAGGELPVGVSTSVVVGHAGTELIQAANENGGAAMVVVGSRGLGGFRSLLLGSVTTYLTHHLVCPLLIIPSAERTAHTA